MDWLKPLDGGTWWNEPPCDPVRRQKRAGPKVRTVAGVQNTLEERIAKAQELSKVYTRAKVARLMKVDQSTVSKWLGAKHREKVPYSKREW